MKVEFGPGEIINTATGARARIEKLTLYLDDEPPKPTIKLPPTRITGKMRLSYSALPGKEGE